MLDPAQLKKWREAHKEIEIGDEPLVTMAPFPSLFSNDFLVYLQSKGVDENVATFVRDMHREMVWVYDNWAKAQRDGNASKLLVDIINCTGGPGYENVRKFLTDYGKANNISVSGAGQMVETPAWFGFGNIQAGPPGPMAQVTAPPPATMAAPEPQVETDRFGQRPR